MKCPNCNKKMNFEMSCKCSKTFCLNCLPSFNHGCSYDYKKENIKILQTKLIKVEKEKIVNI